MYPCRADTAERRRELGPEQVLRVSSGKLVDGSERPVHISPRQRLIEFEPGDSDSLQFRPAAHPAKSLECLHRFHSKFLPRMPRQKRVPRKILRKMWIT